MKYVGIAVLCLLFFACQEKKETKVQLRSQKDSLSYSIGLDIGRNLKRQSIEIDMDVLAEGMKDLYMGKQVELSDSVSQFVTARFRRQMMVRHDKELREQAEKNQKEGEAFLAENKKKDGVVTLPSGLQYKVLTMGTGPKPGAGQTVIVNYVGSLIDGKEFDNSYKRGSPDTLSVNGTIKGWTQTLKMMPVGSKWVLYLPPDLAYGDRGAGQVIPPGATLIFEIELLQVR